MQVRCGAPWLCIQFDYIYIYICEILLAVANSTNERVYVCNIEPKIEVTTTWFIENVNAKCNLDIYFYLFLRNVVEMTDFSLILHIDSI